MPRKRMLDPGFWRDEKIAALTFFERLLFEGLWTFAEDHGVGRANPVLLKSDIFPYDAVSGEEIADALLHLEALGLISLYEIEGQNYYYVVHFKRHQTINRPSRITLPLPPDSERSVSAHDTLTTQKEKEKEEKEKEKKKEKEYSAHGEFQNVLLCREEYEKLLSRFEQTQVHNTIEALSSYMRANGKRYRDHYATLLNWLKRDAKPSAVKNGQPANPFLKLVEDGTLRAP